MDAVVSRARMRTTLIRLLTLMEREVLNMLDNPPATVDVLTAAQRVAIARHPGRPGVVEIVNALFTDFFEQVATFRAPTTRASWAALRSSTGAP